MLKLHYQKPMSAKLPTTLFPLMDAPISTTSCFLVSLVLLLFFSSASALSLPPEEQTAAYTVLETINPSINWRALYSDDLCVSGPHGLVCDYFITSSCNSSSSNCTYTTTIHIIELNFGYVSDFSPNPTCNFTSSNSTSLFKLFSPFPFLKKLFFFNCFVSVSVSPISYLTMPPNLFSLLPSTLEEFVLINNPALSGQIAMDASSLPLRRLVITGTAMSGEILLMPPTLQQLVLSRNSFNGQIPPSISKCTNLKILDLSYNNLTGTIPNQLAQLVNLIKLDLSFNMINGRIPGAISGLKKLELLDLSYNQLTGGIPSSIGEMVGLKEIYLSGNRRIGGQLPEIWEKIGGNLVGIGFSNIGLGGNIPVSMGMFLENLCYLALDNNSLEGPVPVQFSRLERTAKEVNLEGNQLHGPVPFSVDFAVHMGGKLKLGGNRGLCIAGPGSREVNGNLELLPACNVTEMPIPMVVSGAAGQGCCGKNIFWSLLLILGLVL